MFLCDYHFHTDLSFDGKDSLEAVLAFASKKGLAEICVTDHYECGSQYLSTNTPLSVMRETYFKALARNKTDTKLRFGVELGEPLFDLGKAEVAVSYGKFDFVIASLHSVRGEKDFGKMDFTRPDLMSVLDRYYDELEAMVKWGKFDVLGHINYFERYAAKQGVAVDMTRFMPRITDILTKLIAKGKGIEINTSGLFTEVGKTQPDEAVLRLYKRLGGKIVTLGSDAHSKETIGQGIDKACEMLRRVGYDYVTVYEDRAPKFVKF